MRLFKKFKCEKCQNKFKQYEELMQHEQVVHGKDIPYECKECRQSFTSMEQMRTHLQRNHSYSGGRDI